MQHIHHYLHYAGYLLVFLAGAWSQWYYNWVKYLWFVKK